MSSCPRLVSQVSGSLGLGDDGVGEPPQAIHLGLERLGVGPDDIGPAEPHDDVGDALVLESAHTVDAEGVHRDDVRLEGFVEAPRLGPQLVQAREQPGQFAGIPAAVHPAVAR